MGRTIDQIVRGSEMPLAIIIVGVGDADFSSMEQLDGDEEALYSSSLRKYMAADIVQFVPYNDFKNNPHMLAKETLMEVPSQLLNWMRKHNIAPYPRSEDERRRIQQQMTMGAAGMAPGQIPSYFVNKKEHFLQQAQGMGYDLYQCQDFLMTRGIPELQMNNLVENLHNPQYFNVLKPQVPVQMVAPQGGAGTNPMVAMMGNQMVGQVNAQMAAAGHGQQVSYQYQPQH